MTRIAVFLDNQNIYQGARAAFGLHNSHFTEGQIDPLRLGRHLADLGLAVDADRELVAVRIYRGEPSSKYSRAGQAACQRQVAAWAALDLVTPIVRPLKYYPDGTAREKGIDVLIALDIAEGAEVEVTGFALLGGNDLELDGSDPPVGSPLVSIRAFTILGGTDVRTARFRAQRV